MITKICTKNMAREDWLAERRKSIGGSEVGAIMGLNKYQSAVSVWANKIGIVPDAEPNEAMIQGTDLEGYVSERFTRLTGKKVRHCNYILRNDDYPHLHANVDRLVRGESAGLECKTASALSVSKFKGGDFPTSYYAQCVAYMAVTELPVWYLAVVVLGKEFKVFKMVRDGQDTSKPDWCESVTVIDDAEFDAIKSSVADFWQHVEDETMPEIDGSKATSDTLTAMYPGGDVPDIEPLELDDMRDKICVLRDLKDEKHRIDENIRLLENTFKARMEDAETAYCDNVKITWKPQERTTFDCKKFAKDHPSLDLSGYTKTSTTRVFRIKEEN